MSNEISSQKIMEKLRQIKKTFIENSSQPIRQPIHHYLKTSDVKSRDNQKLKKYLPESLGKFASNHIQTNNEGKQHPNTVVTFRKCLQERLENLFIEQKNLMKKRYQSNNINDYNIKNIQSYPVKLLQSKLMRNTGVSNGSFRESLPSNQQNNNMLQMEQKVKQLESKFRMAASTQSKDMLSKDTQHSNQNEQMKKQLGNLRQTLLQLKKSNIKLKSKLNKNKKKQRPDKDQTLEELQKYKQKEKIYLKQIENLKIQMAQFKNRNTNNKQNQCPSRISSRRRILSTKEQNRKKMENQILLDLYAQIDELKYKLNRETKQKLNLQQKNCWLQQQLKNVVNNQ